MKSILKSILSLLLVFIVNDLAIAGNCECDFDTKKYTAKCDCSYTCSVVTKNRRKCNISCTGSAKKQLLDLSDNYIKNQNTFFETYEEVLPGVYAGKLANFSFASKAYPILLKVGYINADFLSSDEKTMLDNIVKSFFDNSEQINNIFRAVNSSSGRSSSTGFTRTIKNSTLVAKKNFIRIDVSLQSSQSIILKLYILR